MFQLLNSRLISCIIFGPATSTSNANTGVSECSAAIRQQMDLKCNTARFQYRKTRKISDSQSVFSFTYVKRNCDGSLSVTVWCDVLLLTTIDVELHDAQNRTYGLKAQVGVIGGVLPGFVTRIHKDSVCRWNLWFPSAGVFTEVLAGRATGMQITFPPCIVLYIYLHCHIWWQSVTIYDWKSYLTQVGQGWCLHQDSKSVFSRLRPWPLTSWPPKLNVSCSCPGTICANLHQNQFNIFQMSRSQLS